MKTILYLDHTAKISGGEIALLNLVGALDRSRFRPVVALATDGPLVRRFKDANVETVVLPLNAAIVDTRKETLGIGSLVNLRQITSIMTYARQIARFAHEVGADVIHTNSLKSDVYGGIAGRMAGIPVVWHVRDAITRDYLSNSAAVAFRMLARCLPSVVVANSQHTLRALNLPADRRARVVYSGIDPAKFAEAQNTSERTRTTPPTVALVGRIAPWKGQHVFIEAAAAVVEKYPECRFQIIGAPLFGEDDYLAELHRLATERKVGDNVEFLGFRPDVAKLVDAADVIVHASVLGEPFGQVVVEAMAAGKPVVAANGGALPEIVIEGVTGYLTKMGSAAEMADKILTLLADPELAGEMGLAGRRRVEEKFTIQQSIDVVEDVYSRIIRPGQASGTPEAVPST